MKKVSLLFMFLFVGAVFTACSGDKNFEVSKEMQDFIGMIKGNYKDVSAAMNKYAANEKLKTDNITMYDLDGGLVKSRDGDCYTVDFKTGISIRTYEICWSNKKIVEVKFLGVHRTLLN